MRRCARVAAWNRRELAELVTRFAQVLEATHVSPDKADDGLVDPEGLVSRLGVEHTAQYIVRPDGHVGFRCAGTSLLGAAEYLDRWFRPES